MKSNGYYPAIIEYMRTAIHIHGGETYVDSDGTTKTAGTLVVPLSFGALKMLTPEEQERAYELSYPLEDQIAFNEELRRYWAERGLDFERPTPDAQRPPPPIEEAPRFRRPSEPPEPQPQVSPVVRRRLVR